MVKALYVVMNGLHVGDLTKKNGEWVFAYAREWLGHPQCRGLSLSLPAFAGRHVGDALKDWIENLLPDNTQIRQRLGRILAVNPADTLRFSAPSAATARGQSSFTRRAARPLRL